MTDLQSPPRWSPPSPVGGVVADAGLERRGRRWLLWSFLLCPCHLPLTLGILTGVLAGTSLGAVVRDNRWAAGAVISATWVIGTAYGFVLIRRAQRSGGACPTG